MMLADVVSCFQLSFFLYSSCRFAADQLKHEYGVELVNVFDMMLADVVSCFQ